VSARRSSLSRASARPLPLRTAGVDARLEIDEPPARRVDRRITRGDAAQRLRRAVARFAAPAFGADGALPQPLAALDPIAARDERGERIGIARRGERGADERCEKQCAAQLSRRRAVRSRAPTLGARPREPRSDARRRI